MCVGGGEPCAGMPAPRLRGILKRLELEQPAAEDQVRPARERRRRPARVVRFQLEAEVPRWRSGASRVSEVIGCFAAFLKSMFLGIIRRRPT
mmetsp:Transcript_90828/g.241367  ORF Transcript_90828/g.241367 Transcript_90828/m.241367 type:complete len:92 (+) Transcript_90828:62-337(+)